MATLDISKPLSRAFDTMGSNLGTFLTLSLVFAGIPTAVLTWWMSDSLASEDPQALLAIFQSSAFWSNMAISILVNAILGAILQGALASATIGSLAGQRVEAGDALAAGLTLFLPVAVIGLIFALGTTLGFILLIFPGVMLWLCWCVAMPAYVRERGGIFAAFGRSLALTEGNRGNLFLLGLVLVIGLWVVGAVIGFIGVFFRESLMMGALIQGVSAAISSMVMITVLAATYVALVELKEGSSESELETIFD